MNQKCRGCGAVLQDVDYKKIGYTKDLNKTYCNRCFRMKHYAEYQRVEKKQSDYISILKEIDQTEDLIVLVADAFMFTKQILFFKKYIHRPILLVLTKRDILPLSFKEEKIKKYMKNLNIPLIDVEMVSSYKNNHLDCLFEKINHYKKSSFVYFVGYTNAGKSTLINKIIYNYSDSEAEIMTSIMPSTTLDSIEVTLNPSLTIVDTPGLLLEKSLMNKVDGKMLSKIMPQKEIKPITYQIKSKQYIYIENLIEIEVVDPNNLTFYMSNRLEVQRYYKRKEKYPFQTGIFVKKGKDIVIEGLGFITSSFTGKLNFTCQYDILIYTRKSIIK